MARHGVPASARPRRRVDGQLWICKEPGIWTTIVPGHPFKPWRLNYVPGVRRGDGNGWALTGPDELTVPGGFDVGGEMIDRHLDTAMRYATEWAQTGRRP